VREQARVTYVEGDRPVVPLLDTSHVATRGAEAVATLDGADGTDLDGSGVSIAIIDSGIDGTHPFFREADGSSKVVRNLKSHCVVLEFVNPDLCFQDVPGNDSDTLSTGGHGTHVAGIAAGNPMTLANGRTVMGAAPGAKLVGLAVGQAVRVYGGNPASTGCSSTTRRRAARASCADLPPIRVTNQLLRRPRRSEYDPQGTTEKLQRASAGRGRADGLGRGQRRRRRLGLHADDERTGHGPAPGILMVASSTTPAPATQTAT
jgi:serine protease AprX